MKEQLIHQSCREFSEALASKAPVPGGGGAAALIGALAAALGSMAVNLSLGKKDFLLFEADHRRMLREADSLRRRFLSLTEEDAAAFEPLSRAYSMPKSSPDYAGVMASATLRAAEAPLEMMRCCCRLIALLEELREKASPLLLSDVGCASEAARSALICAAMNVFANTRMLPDNGKAQDLAAQAESMLSEYIPRAQAVSDSVMGCLREPKT